MTLKRLQERRQVLLPSLRISTATDKNADTHEDYDDSNNSIKSYFDLFNLIKRFQSNKMNHYLTGKELHASEVDSIINVFSIVNALIVTIPFSLLSSVNYTF